MIKYCPFCGNEIKNPFSGESDQIIGFKCRKCKKSIKYLNRIEVSPEFKEGDYLPVIWPAFTRR